MNTFGQFFRITSFGESHGPALGVVIDGCPAGVKWRDEWIARNLDRRRPGGALVSGRQESDRPEILSGIYEGRTLGTPIAMIVRNQDARSDDYKSVGDRIGHADDLWRIKFGHSDPRGGGRASGRETVSRVLAGSVAQMLLAEIFPVMKVIAFTRKMHHTEVTEEAKIAEILREPSLLDQLPGRLPDREKSQEVERLLVEAKASGESFGGIAEVRVLQPPRGLGMPVFRKLKADLASAFMGVGAAMGVELGDGDSDLKGTQFHVESESPIYGGIRGGISTGESIVFRVKFKPTSSVGDVAKKGRHDPFIIPRALPVLEAMAHLVLADHALSVRLDRA